jgi:hypothetical protein
MGTSSSPWANVQTMRLPDRSLGNVGVGCGVGSGEAVALGDGGATDDVGPPELPGGVLGAADRVETAVGDGAAMEGVPKVISAGLWLAAAVERSRSRLSPPHAPATMDRQARTATLRDDRMFRSPFVGLLTPVGLGRYARRLRRSISAVGFMIGSM